MENVIMLQAPEWSFEYGFFGYTIQYRGKAVGGAGTIKRGRRLRSNLCHYHNMALYTINELKAGRGSADMLLAATKIEMDAQKK